MYVQKRIEDVERGDRVRARSERPEGAKDVGQNPSKEARDVGGGEHASAVKVGENLRLRLAGETGKGAARGLDE